MAQYVIPLDLDDPKNPIAHEMAHIRAHCTNHGVTITGLTLLTGPLRFRVTTDIAVPQAIIDHFKFT